MPYKSTKQRGKIHALAAKGVAWAKKYADEADKQKQPTVKYTGKAKRKRRERAAKKKMRR